MANCVGYQNLQELDAISGIHDWDYACLLVNQQKLTMIDTGLSATGRQWDATAQLWLGEGNRQQN